MSSEDNDDYSIFDEPDYVEPTPEMAEEDVVHVFRGRRETPAFSVHVDQHGDELLVVLPHPSKNVRPQKPVGRYPDDDLRVKFTRSKRFKFYDESYVTQDGEDLTFVGSVHDTRYYEIRVVYGE